MRLIDADEVLARIENPYQRAEIARWLRDAPTIEERKTGKWIRGDAEKLTGSQRCSICHKVCYKGNDYFNYCPNCGSEMEVTYVGTADDI